MPAQPSRNKSAPSTVWVHNLVTVRTRSGAIEAGNVILNDQRVDLDGANRRIHPTLTQIHPGLCEVDRGVWERHAKDGQYKVGPRTVRAINLDKLSGEDLRQAVEDTADAPTVAKLAEMGGAIGEIASNVIHDWGDPERSHRRAIIEHLAAPSNRARAS